MALPLNLGYCLLDDKFHCRIAGYPHHAILPNDNFAPGRIFEEAYHASLLSDDAGDFIAGHAENPSASELKEVLAFHRDIDELLARDIDNTADQIVPDAVIFRKVVPSRDIFGTSFFEVEDCRICRVGLDLPAIHRDIEHFSDD